MCLSAPTQPLKQTRHEPHQRFAISRTEPFAGTIVWAYDGDGDGNKTLMTQSNRVINPVSRIGWMIIEKGFGGHDREGDLRRGIHDTLDAIKAAAESTQNLPPRTRTSHRVNGSPASRSDRNIPSSEGVVVRFSYRMVPEVYQVFWAGMAAGEFISDAAIAAGSYRNSSPSGNTMTTSGADPNGSAA
jgi:hypothetical protein